MSDAEKLKLLEAKELARKANCFIAVKGLIFLIYRRTYMRNELILKTSDLNKLLKVAKNQLTIV